MRMNTFYKVLSSLAVLVALGACGGSTPAADEPEESAKSSDDSESKKNEEKKSEGEDGDEKADKKDDKDEEKADKKDKKEEEAPSTEGPKFTRTAKDILLAPEVVFMFSFNDSDAYKEVEAKCEKTAKDDAKKKNECIAKARKKFENLDGYRFEKDGEKWVWHTVRKQGTKLVSIHKIVVEIEEKDKIVILKPTGRDKGSKPWANPPKEVKFEVPNDYQITQDDPKQGKLVYEAKIGILGDGSKPAR